MARLFVVYLMLAPLFFSNVTQAGELKGVKGLVKLAKSQVTQKDQGVGLELYGGEKISLSTIKKRWMHKKTVKEVLGRKEIELTSGGMIYPEEVQYALVQRIKKFGEVAKAPHSKAPQEDQ